MTWLQMASPVQLVLLQMARHPMAESPELVSRNSMADIPVQMALLQMANPRSGELPGADGLAAVGQ